MVRNTLTENHQIRAVCPTRDKGLRQSDRHMPFAEKGFVQQQLFEAFTDLGRIFGNHAD